jgi:hypothetical protein
MGETRNAYTTIVWKSEGMIHIGRLGRELVRRQSILNK